MSNKGKGIAPPKPWHPWEASRVRESSPWHSETTKCVRRGIKSSESYYAREEEQGLPSHILHVVNI